MEQHPQRNTIQIEALDPDTAARIQIFHIYSYTNTQNTFSHEFMLRPVATYLQV